MRAQYNIISLLIGIVINVGIVYLVLKNVKHLERILGAGGVAILRKVFGIILLAIAVKIFRTNSGI
jgi:multiple antibiotic resistance protein